VEQSKPHPRWMRSRTLGNAAVARSCRVRANPIWYRLSISFLVRLPRTQQHPDASPETILRTFAEALLPSMCTGVVSSYHVKSFIIGYNTNHPSSTKTAIPCRPYQRDN
jgi:hypothetical protein